MVCEVCENRCQYCHRDYQCSECESWKAEGRYGIPYKIKEKESDIQKIINKYSYLED